jgi:hypothetical protein
MSTGMKGKGLACLGITPPPPHNYLILNSLLQLFNLVNNVPHFPYLITLLPANMNFDIELAQRMH